MQGACRVIWGYVPSFPTDHQETQEEFPNIRAVPVMRTGAFWGLCWGPLFRGPTIINGGFLKLGVPYLGSLIRIIVYRGLHKGPLIKGNYHVGLGKSSYSYCATPTNIHPGPSSLSSVFSICRFVVMPRIGG